MTPSESEEQLRKVHHKMGSDGCCLAPTESCCYCGQDWPCATNLVLCALNESRDTVYALHTALGKYDSPTVAEVLEQLSGLVAELGVSVDSGWLEYSLKYSTKIRQIFEELRLRGR